MNNHKKEDYGDRHLNGKGKKRLIPTFEDFARELGLNLEVLKHGDQQKDSSSRRDHSYDVEENYDITDNFDVLETYEPDDSPREDTWMNNQAPDRWEQRQEDWKKAQKRYFDQKIKDPDSHRYSDTRDSSKNTSFEKTSLRLEEECRHRASAKLRAKGKQKHRLGEHVLQKNRFSREEVRQGLIWSEILQPPLSKRRK